MAQRTRILIAVATIALVGLVVLGAEGLRRLAATNAAAAAEVTPVPGGIPISLNGRIVASFTVADLDRLEKVSFTEPAEGKVQEGWRLADLLALHLRTEPADSDTITVRSSSRSKSATLTWAEVRDPANWVMFDLSNRGTLKLVSVLPRLDDRDEWVQDADSIEISRP